MRLYDTGWYNLGSLGSEDALNLGEGPSTVKGVHHIGLYVDDLEEVSSIEDHRATECPSSSKVNHKYKGS